MPGYDSVNRNVLSRVRKVARDGADVTSGGSHVHIRGSAIEKLGCRQWNGEPEAERGSRCRKSEAVGDLVVVVDRANGPNPLLLY